MTELTVQVLAGVIVAALAGVVGASYELHRRRSRPFVLVTGIGGSVLKQDIRVDVPADIRDQLATAAFLTRLNPTDPLSQVRSALKNVEMLNTHGTVLADALQVAVTAVTAAADDSGALEAAFPAMDLGFFDAFVMTALVRERIVLQTPPGAGGDAKIEVFEVRDKDNGLHFQLAIPGHTLQLGRKLEEHPVVRHRLQPLISALRTVDRSAIALHLESILRVLRSELAIAKAVEPPLKSLENRHSRWAVYLFLANYGETAMLIMPQGKLQVRRNRFERPISEPCELVGVDEDGASVHSTGLLVRPSEHVKFFYATSRTQSQMDRGNELRGRFTDATSNCRLSFKVVSAGLRSQRTVASSWQRFKPQEKS